MEVLLETRIPETRCPSCDSEALYKYGKLKSGKQRFLCLMCGKQYTLDPKKIIAQGKPTCHECGKTMHLYKIEGDVIRFRCSGYPGCKTFKKFRMKEELGEPLHP